MSLFYVAGLAAVAGAYPAVLNVVLSSDHVFENLRELAMKINIHFFVVTASNCTPTKGTHLPTANRNLTEMTIKKRRQNTLERRKIHIAEPVQ